MVNATGDDNATAQALKRFCGDCDVPAASEFLPFSSQRKYSAARLESGTVAVGAAEFMFKKTNDVFEKESQELLRQGLRVLAVGVSSKGIEEGVSQLVPAAIIALSDTVRDDATEIIGWFKNNDVDVKIISGDNPLSVSVIAAKVGVRNADKYVSLEGMDDQQVAEAATRYTVFGRVTPDQKAILVKAMKAAGKTVAMVGGTASTTFSP